MVYYNMEYHRSHSFFLAIHTSLRAGVYSKNVQLTSVTFMVFHDAIENTVRGNTINVTYRPIYTGAFLYSDWLYFLMV